MKRNGFLKLVLIGFLVVIMVPFGALSQQVGSSGNGFSEGELDQMLAPIALYPDSLLAQILVAATYPDEVTAADRWVKAHSNITGDALPNALSSMKWDESVKALAAFPQVLAMMASENDWTQSLGDAFMSQQADVTASIQRLRHKAYAAGNLQTTAEQKVVVKGEYVDIEPVNPEVIYVPRYNPVVVYGAWAWPAYEPYVYAPVWPGVEVGVVGAFGFFPSIGIGVGWGGGFGGFDWGGGGFAGGWGGDFGGGGGGDFRGEDT
jgi:uncharacterized membrane protein YgcG